MCRPSESEGRRSGTELAKKCKTSDLATTEVAIDGKIYDLKGFDHPGGDVIMLFGGNDVSTQYHMIHSRHTARHLEKMKCVGEVTDHQPDYIFDTPFERDIKAEVFKIVKPGQEYGTPGYFFRAALFITALFTLQAIWVFFGSSYTVAIAFGVSQALIGLNVQHDANHGAASRNPVVNGILGLGADLIGGCKFLWMEQHWTHHSFTNHAIKDPDAHSAEPMLLFTNYPKGHPMRKWYHNFQSLFFIPILSLYWFSSIFNVNIFTLHHVGAEQAGVRMDNEYIKSKRPQSIAIRAFYILSNVVTPFLYHSAWTAVGHITAMAVAESLTLSVLFSLSHNFEGSDRDPSGEWTRKEGESAQPVDWFKAQVETSSTYGGFVAGYLTGGLNFQIEHHLFPKMSSAWYPYIQPAIRKVCEKHGVRYAYYPYVWQNLWSTFKYMHEAGVGAAALDPLSGKN